VRPSLRWRAEGVSSAPQVCGRRCSSICLEALSPSWYTASNPLPPGLRKPGSVGVETGTSIAILAANGGAVAICVGICLAQSPALADSLEGAGDRLFTFTRFPVSQWRSARTTNAIEWLREEFKRRIKTQTVLPSAETAILGTARRWSDHHRKVDGWQTLTHKLVNESIDLPCLIQYPRLTRMARHAALVSLPMFLAAKREVPARLRRDWTASSVSRSKRSWRLTARPGC
jgi:hypothetical protein